MRTSTFLISMYVSFSLLSMISSMILLKIKSSGKFSNDWKILDLKKENLQAHDPLFCVKNWLTLQILTSLIYNLKR